MQINEHDLYTIDQAVEEISSILARGYLHYEKSRRLATESGGPAANAKQGEDSGRKDLLVRPTRAFMRPRVNAPR
jgi:hypothetical protein